MHVNAIMKQTNKTNTLQVHSLKADIAWLGSMQCWYAAPMQADNRNSRRRRSLLAGLKTIKGTVTLLSVCCFVCAFVLFVCRKQL